MSIKNPPKGGPRTTSTALAPFLHEGGTQAPVKAGIRASPILDFGLTILDGRPKSKIQNLKSKIGCYRCGTAPDLHRSSPIVRRASGRLAHLHWLLYDCLGRSITENKRLSNLSYPGILRLWPLITPQTDVRRISTGRDFPLDIPATGRCIMTSLLLKSPQTSKLNLILEVTMANLCLNGLRKSTSMPGPKKTYRRKVTEEMSW